MVNLTDPPTDGAEAPADTRLAELAARFAAFLLADGFTPEDVRAMKLPKVADIMADAAARAGQRHLRLAGAS